MLVFAGLLVVIAASAAYYGGALAAVSVIAAVLVMYFVGRRAVQRETGPYLDQLCTDLERSVRGDRDAPGVAETVGKLRRLLRSSY